MVKIEGLYNTAFCYTPVLEDAARAQIQSVCDQKEFAGCKIRVMPDVHAGKGCTIGTTMTIRDKIVQAWSALISAAAWKRWNCPSVRLISSVWTR